MKKTRIVTKKIIKNLHLKASEELLGLVGSQKKKRSITKRKGQKNAQHSVLVKHEGNPILSPHKENNWESYQTFNPAAIYEGGKVHLLYRAIGGNGLSVVGYASSRDGMNIEERATDPVYIAIHPGKKHNITKPIHYSSGGSWGGCEDPRAVTIGDRIYMTFVAFDGWGSVRMALTSIDLNDFLAKKWKWKRPMLVSPPWEIHKNWVLFPEKIKGKFAILHSISPKILVDYFDNLDTFDDRPYIKSHHGQTTNNGQWDNWVRGAGPPPIKTPYGWLLLYHAMDKSDPNRYKLGAMILDKNDPTKILHRSKQPILEPDESYENEGHKAGVIYSCGAVVVKDKLFVYYGGADTVVCVATADLETFLNTLAHSQEPKLKRIR
ncbi:MAG: glycosidase [Patescibacteria group bacterium]|mgnify:FL=1